VNFQRSQAVVAGGEWLVAEAFATLITFQLIRRTGIGHCTLSLRRRGVAYYDSLSLGRAAAYG
jgi:hypothetical protein